MTTYRIPLLLTGLFLILSLRPAAAHACGGSYYYEPYSFFEPQLFSRKEFLPYQMDMYGMFKPEEEVDYSSEEIYPSHHAGILRDWKAYLGNDLPDADLNRLLFGTGYETLEKLEKTVQKGTGIPASPLNLNASARRIASRRDLATATYLRLAMQVSILADYDPEWDTESPPAFDLEALHAEISGKIASETVPFLKKRYVFLGMRTLFMQHEWNAAVRLYEEKWPVGGKEEIDTWARSYYAGALYRSGKQGKGVFLFSQLFSEAPAYRDLSWRSAQNFQMTAWEEALEMCKSPQERVAVLAFEAVNNEEAPVMHTMQEIYKTDPANPLLTLLLTREINRTERNRLDAYDIHFGQEMHGALEARSLAQFAARVADEGKADMPGAWAMGSAWLYYLGGDYAAVETRLQAIDKFPALQQNKEIQGMRTVFRFLNHITALPKLDRAAEEDLMTRYTTLQRSLSADQLEYMTPVMLEITAWHYAQQGDSLHEALCKLDVTDFQYLYYAPFLEQVYAFTLRKNLSAFETMLLQRQGITAGGIAEILGTIALNENALDEAEAWFQKVPADYAESFYINRAVFDFVMPECVHCEPGDGNMTKLEFTRRLRQLQRDADKPGQAGVDARMALGNMLYQTTSNSFGRSVFTFYYDTYEDYGTNPPDWFYTAIESHRFPYGSEGMNTAMALFQDVALQSQNPEQQAQALIQLAKCQYNYLVRSSDTDDVREYAKTYDRLWKGFRKTVTFQQFRAECGFVPLYEQSLKGKGEFPTQAMKLGFNPW